MKMMERRNFKTLLLSAVAIYCISVQALGAGSSYPLMRMDPNLDDKASLQRGMQTFMNDCFGCHSLQYQRYNRTARDLGIPEELMLKHVIIDPDVRIGSLMENNISVDHAKQWFGAVPPDLTLVARLRGGRDINNRPDWLYTFLLTFYEDEARPLGVNNLVFENVGMPHPLVNLQGVQQRVCKDVPQLAANGGEIRDPLTNEYVTENLCGEDLIGRGISPLQHVEGTGELTPDEYEQVIYDLTNFLYYVAEPIRADRERIGVYVLIFLAILYVFTWLLAREYHKEYH